MRIATLSLGERVASVATQVRGCWVMWANLIPPRRASDPSPGPRRLMKAPVAVHPLPSGEGKTLSRCTPFLTSRKTVFGYTCSG